MRWFKVVKCGNAFTYLRCSETAHVARSLAGYMYSSPDELGLTSGVVKVSNKVYPLGRFLGEGHTSSVYVVTVWAAKLLLLKCPRQEMCFCQISSYLEKLHGIKGIPSIKSAYSTSVTAVFTTPVCSKLTPDVLFKGGMQHHLAKLVDILECAHEMMVVHRDVRTENIMIANSQFFIVDWGYAATLNDPVRYVGTTYFASARVLKILEEGTTTVATKACDDLVSLVQSISLLVRRNEKWRKSLYALSMMDYAGIRKFWEEHFGLPSNLLRHAQNTSYSKLKNCIESWALSL